MCVTLPHGGGVAFHDGPWLSRRAAGHDQVSTTFWVSATSCDFMRFRLISFSRSKSGCLRFRLAILTVKVWVSAIPPKVWVSAIPRSSRSKSGCLRFLAIPACDSCDSACERHRQIAPRAAAFQPGWGRLLAASIPSGQLFSGSPTRATRPTQSPSVAHHTWRRSTRTSPMTWTSNACVWRPSSSYASFQDELFDHMLVRIDDPVFRDGRLAIAFQLADAVVVHGRRRHDFYHKIG